MRKYIFLLAFVFISFFVFADSTYTVKKGDTLYSISRKYQITVAELRAANNLSETDILKEGAKLVVPQADIQNAAALSEDKTPAFQNQSSSSLKTESPVVKTVAYTVQKGDTLYGIARKNNIKLNELLSLNNIDTNTTLKVGQKILVPDSQAKKSTQQTKDSPKKDAGIAQVKQASATGKENAIINASGVTWPLSNPKIQKISGKVSGVELTGSDNESVKAVREGTVMYTGIYRGFGEIVFIQSKTGLIYSYSGLGKVTAKKGDYVVSGAEIGKTGRGNDSSIKFMVFQNGNPIDPVKAPRG